MGRSSTGLAVSPRPGGGAYHMIEGLDSSFDEPTLEQARQAYAAGVRAWGGYFGSRDGLGLAVRWNRMSFWNVQQAGMRAIGFCSGWDDPDWIRRTAAEWDILACADVEFGIREDGDWVDDWVARAASGLYGNTSVHYRAGRPPGRGAAFNVAAWYFKVPPECWDPQMTWPWWLPATGRPTGWQFCGTHDEFGLSVDRSWLDDWFAPALTSNPIGGDMTPEEHQTLSD